MKQKRIKHEKKTVQKKQQHINSDLAGIFLWLI